MLTKYGNIVNEEGVVRIVNMLTEGNFVNIDAVISKAIDGDVIEYLNLKLEKVAEKNAIIKFVPLQLCNSRDDRGLYLSFDKPYGDRDYWQGSRVGTYAYLMRTFKEMVTEVPGKNDSATTGYSSIYAKLADKEKWLNLQSITKFERLENYLSGLLGRIENLTNQNAADSIIIYSDDQKYAIINSGLLDIFGNDIKIRYKTDGQNFYEPAVVESTTQLKQMGFNKFDVNVVQFFDKINDVIFDRKVSISDFDFSDSYRLTHVIQTRIDRLTGKVSEMREIEILARIKNSVEYALKVAKIDYNYIIPQYSIKGNKIQFLIPLFIDLDFTAIPNGVLVVECIDGLWMPMTLLSIDEASKNARLVNKVSTSWLRDIL